MAGKHLEPVPQSSSTTIIAPPVKKGLPKFRLAIIAALLVLGGGSLLTAWWPGSSDHVSNATRNELQKSFATLTPLQLEPVAPQDMERALDTMHLDTPQRAQLRAAVTSSLATHQTDQTRLVWVEVWDFASEDGDVVHLASAGFSIDCNLLNAHQRIAIPVDATHRLTVTGAVDGGGGITLGIHTNTGPVLLPVLAPGQTLQLPLGI